MKNNLLQNIEGFTLQN